jgi:hypothetical protein
MKRNATINKANMKNLDQKNSGSKELDLDLKELSSQECSRTKKGIVFTLEALIVFSIFIIVISFVYILVQQQNKSLTLYQKVFLDDIFQVLELKYHDDIVIFEKEGTVSDSLKEYLQFIKDSTGESVFISFNKRIFSPDPLCDPSNPQMTTKRLVVYPSIYIDEGLSEINSSVIDSSLVKINYFHSLNLGIC